MQYQIKGDTLPVAICHLSPGESLISEAGAMGWMSDNIIMDTNMKGGLFGGIGRAFSGESVFLNTFTCQGSDGIIAFPSSVPGKIIARHLAWRNYHMSKRCLSGRGSFCRAKSSF